MKNLLFILMAGLLLSCSSTTTETPPPSTLSEANVAKVRASLTALLHRENSDAFVIITEPGSQKFIQFAGSANEDLYLSLPSAQMSKDELSKAKKVLKQYEVEFESIQADTPEGSSAPTVNLDEFYKVMGQDVEGAVEIVSVVMMDIFGFDENVELDITEN